MSKLKEISHLIGPGPKMFFAVDTESKPGTKIFHFVQFHTLQIEGSNMDDVEFKAIHLDNDPRLEFLANCIRFGPRKHQNKHHRT